MRRMALWLGGLVIALITTLSYAEDVRMIEGYIEDVRGSRIRVQEQQYDVSSATVKDAASGAAAARTDLRKGTKVQLFVQDDRVLEVLIFSRDILE